MGATQCKPARGPGGMLLQEILKLRSSEIAGNMYFSTNFCIFKVFKEGSQGALVRVFENWRGTCPLCLPPIPTSMFALMFVEIAICWLLA